MGYVQYIVTYLLLLFICIERGAYEFNEYSILRKNGRSLYIYLINIMNMHL